MWAKQAKISVYALWDWKLHKKMKWVYHSNLIAALVYLTQGVEKFFGIGLHPTP